MRISAISCFVTYKNIVYQGWSAVHGLITEHELVNRMNTRKSLFVCLLGFNVRAAVFQLYSDITQKRGC